jgi:threonine dehydrogenase-like Zn-dependent dehydrogenase
MDETGYEDFTRSDQPVVLGHEFVGEIAGYGPGSRRKVRTGTRVVALPMLRRGNGVPSMIDAVIAPAPFFYRVVSPVAGSTRARS